METLRLGAVPRPEAEPLVVGLAVDGNVVEVDEDSRPEAGIVHLPLSEPAVLVTDPDRVEVIARPGIRMLPGADDGEPLEGLVVCLR